MIIHAREFLVKIPPKLPGDKNRFTIPRAMKILLYNMEYGTGLNGSLRDYFLKWWRYFWCSNKILQKIIRMLRRERADMICLLEADTGSIRTRFQSQIKAIVDALELPFYRSLCKYDPLSLWAHLPIFKHQHTGILSRQKGVMIPHYLRSGMKKLVQETIIKGFSIFVVHLGRFKKETRKKQLQELTVILKKCQRPYVVCGDFNIYKGLQELDWFLTENNLRLVQSGPSFPAAHAKKTLDLFMVSKKLRVKQSGVVHSALSDHLPVWVEVV